MTMPLSRLRVLDLTRARAGPAAIRQLADWGADVVMIEPPGGVGDMIGQRGSPDFENLHRNKRSITLDIKTDEGRDAFYELAKTADVIVENMRPGAKRRMKVDYDTIKAINPRIVYASISGFGQDGPYADRPGVDQIIQGMSGLMSMTGYPDSGPLRVGIAIADMSAGIFCASGILLALFERERTGKGRWLRTSLIQSQIAMLDFQAARWLMQGEVPTQEGNHHPTYVPMGLFDTADGQVNLAASGSDMFEKFCKTAGRTEWLEDPRFADTPSRYVNRDVLRAEVSALMVERTSDEWVRVCNAAGIPCGPVYTVDQMFADPQVTHLNVTRKVINAEGESLELLAQPFDFSDLQAQITTVAPRLGEHTDEILRSIGYSDQKIKNMRDSRVL